VYHPQAPARRGKRETFYLPKGSLNQKPMSLQRPLKPQGSYLWWAQRTTATYKDG